MTAKAKLILICESNPIYAAVTIASLEESADQILNNKEEVMKQYSKGFITGEAIIGWAEKVKEICNMP